MKKTAHRFATILGLFLAATPAWGTPTCPPSTSMLPPNYPSAARIPPSNNLVLPTGKAIPADGQILTLSGRILDKNCAPVANAVVELWQASPYGRWLLAERADLANVNPVFAGAGRTYTSIDGGYAFITLFPAATPQFAAPTLNIRIKAQGFPEYKSTLFFEGDIHNMNERKFTDLNPAARSDISIHIEPDDADRLLGTRDIILPGKTPYRVY